MTSTRIFAAVRFLFGAVTLIAVGTQLGIHIGNGFSVLNFFSYFTNLSNIFAAVVLLVESVLTWRGKDLGPRGNSCEASPWSAWRWWALFSARCCVTWTWARCCPGSIPGCTTSCPCRGGRLADPVPAPPHFAARNCGSRAVPAGLPGLFADSRRGHRLVCLPVPEPESRRLRPCRYHLCHRCRRLRRDQRRAVLVGEQVPPAGPYSVWPLQLVARSALSSSLSRARMAAVPISAPSPMIPGFP